MQAIQHFCSSRGACGGEIEYFCQRCDTIQAPGRIIVFCVPAEHSEANPHESDDGSDENRRVCEAGCFHGAGKKPTALFVYRWEVVVVPGSQVAAEALGVVLHVEDILAGVRVVQCI